MWSDLRARERFTSAFIVKVGVSRSGERPEPTVKVRMEESVHGMWFRPQQMLVIALGDVSLTKRR